MKNNLIVINSLIFLVIASCFQAGAHAQTAALESKTYQMQQDILLYINQYRIKHGRSALQMNNAISKEATLHSQDMAAHRVPFGHQGFAKRIKNLYAVIKQAHSGAENVAYNYKNAEIVVREWIKSPGHKKNIMGNYNLTGIGIAYDKKGKIYYTQIFIRTA
ncbi:putative transporter [Legionella beliardensis]|uniref:Putative transporter n=1 Tax=Legionella beliardensis TaxID=91822 RepID=A0A378I430_9GAMM|nr:CAP domain-containing protein [Legionella beliardensis]STX29451.1 putative transporter [Legionella beliardensis]